VRYVGKTLHFKQGETFSFVGVMLSKADRAPIETEGISVRSQIRQATAERELIANLTCQILDDAAIRIYFVGDTTEWAFGNALWDIQVVDAGGQVRVTESVEMVIDRYVTKAP